MPKEIDYFVTMLEKTRKRMSSEQVTTIRRLLEEASHKVQKEESMTVYEHAMIGINGTLAMGLHRLRRPRTGGFLAGRFYAATAGAFSAS